MFSPLATGRWASRSLLSQFPRPGRLAPGFMSAISQSIRWHNIKVEVAKDGLGFLCKPVSGGPECFVDISEFWLRDNCHCFKCINQDTKQKNYDTFEIPPFIKAIEASTGPKGVRVQWSDGHKSLYSWNWILRILPGQWQDKISNVFWGRKTWNSSWITQSAPKVDYRHVMSRDEGSRGMAKLTDNIRRMGMSFVKNCPPTPEATQDLLERIGPIRNTHYGGFYDFTPNLEKADTAYTNIALPAHTDTTYFTDPAGLQAFHMLSHVALPGEESAEGQLGGKSLLVDGFHAALRLKQQHYDLFKTLCTVKIPWHASGNDGIAIVPDATYPVIETINGHPSSPITRIRWNNADRGVVPHDKPETAEKWYAAAKAFNDILKSEEMEYWYQLQPGTIVIFDNWRVLHGRSEFKGTRRICGGYINRDDFISRWKTSNFLEAQYSNHNLFQPPWSVANQGLYRKDAVKNDMAPSLAALGGEDRLFAGEKKAQSKPPKKNGKQSRPGKPIDTRSAENILGEQPNLVPEAEKLQNHGSGVKVEGEETESQDTEAIQRDDAEILHKAGVKSHDIPELVEETKQRGSE